MTKQVQRRRGTTAQHTGFTGAEGEITVNTTNKSAVVHDGATAGGVEAARADLANVDGANIASTISGETVASLTVTSADINGGTIDSTTVGASTPSSGAFTTLTTTGGATIGGDLTVNGTTTTINSTALTVDDINVTLASGAVDAAAANGAGITVDGASATFNYASTGDKWTMNKPLDVTGVITTDGLTTSADINFGDNDKAIFGAGSDLQIYHDGGNSNIYDSGTGNLILKTNGVAINIQDINNDVLGSFNGTLGAVYLNHISGGIASNKLATTATGVDVTGDIAVDRVVNSGVASTASTPTYTWGGQQALTGMYLPSSSTIAFSTNATERMRITSNGDIRFYDSTGVTQGFFWDASTQRLGLGTTTPAVELEIASGQPEIRLTDTDGTDQESTFVQAGGTLFLNLQNNTNNGAFRLRGFGGGVGTDHLTVLGSGNVGIGTVSPATTLDVQGGNITQGATGSNAGRFLIDNTTDTVQRLKVSRGGSTGQLAFHTGADTEAMRIDSSGNLLVGTTSLVVANSASNNGYVFNTNGELEIGSTSRCLTANRQGSDGDAIRFQKDGSTVGTIGVKNDDNLYIATDDTNDCGLKFAGDEQRIEPCNADGTARDNSIDLGAPVSRFKDLYLSGGVYVGGTGSANYLDDYEEGTWTPAFNLVTVTHTVQYGHYIKIGKMVHCKARIEVSSIDNTDPSGIQMTVPISANSTVANGGTGCTFGYDSQNSQLMDGSHPDVHGAYVSGTTFAVTNDTGGNMQYAQLTQTSGAFVFAFSYEAA